MIMQRKAQDWFVKFSPRELGNASRYAQFSFIDSVRQQKKIDEMAI